MHLPDGSDGGGGGGADERFITCRHHVHLGSGMGCKHRLKYKMAHLATNMEGT